MSAGLPEGRPPQVSAETPRESLDLVRSLYAAFNAGGIAALRDFIPDDFEWHDAPETPDADVYRGYGGVVEALGKYMLTMGAFELDVEEVRGIGDEVAVFLTVRASDADSMVPRDTKTIHICTVRDGQLKRVRGFFDRDMALKAAWLSD